ncbi:5-bromo-4-chloroindolyl phosphate hydrolysis family protein [Zavarzinia sp. CC-PAN008]|uniref:5-bromo-4-chloroindolyl phosphate hydrolysis family protein n=1 Tax=Zavarzinia sp. CC-PAN008 TaxID=3243332 RepID=UPI003F74A231
MRFLRRRRDLAAGLAGAAAFLGLHLLAGLGFMPALMLAVVGYVGTRVALAPVKEPFAEIKPGDAASMHVPLATELITEGRRKIQRMDELIARVRGQEIRDRARVIRDHARRVVANLEQDPADANRTRRLLTYYLDTVIKILDHSIVITSQGGQDHESVARVVHMLSEVEQVFAQASDRMLENDMMELDTELSLLERTLQAERPQSRPRS